MLKQVASILCGLGLSLMMAGTMAVTAVADEQLENPTYQEVYAAQNDIGLPKECGD